MRADCAHVPVGAQPKERVAEQSRDREGVHIESTSPRNLTTANCRAGLFERLGQFLQFQEMTIDSRGRSLPVTGFQRRENGVVLADRGRWIVAVPGVQPSISMASSLVSSLWK